MICKPAADNGWWPAVKRKLVTVLSKASAVGSRHYISGRFQGVTEARLFACSAETSGKLLNKINDDCTLDGFNVFLQY